MMRLLLFGTDWEAVWANERIKFLRQKPQD